MKIPDNISGVSFTPSYRLPTPGGATPHGRLPPIEPPTPRETAINRQQLSFSSKDQEPTEEIVLDDEIDLALVEEEIVQSQTAKGTTGLDLDVISDVDNNNEGGNYDIYTSVNQNIFQMPNGNF